MPNKNLHEKAFDEATIQKLDIFELYTQEWLPTFIMSGHKKIYIFDFFAGPGYSITHQEGSPIRILRQVISQLPNIFTKGTQVVIIFNEYDRDKHSQLVKAIDNFINANAILKRAITAKNVIIPKPKNEDFEKLFSRIQNAFGSAPALMFLDQNGIKFLGDKYLLPLLNSKSTDFLYYVSSSYFNRFGEEEAFKAHLKLDMDEARKNPYKYIHRILLKSLREKIPQTSDMMLYPFSIKKGSNIYGIIFGTSHVRGADKFLRVAWGENEKNGEANFDIDDDTVKETPGLFDDDPNYAKELTKIAKFKNDVRQFVLEKRLKTNIDVYLFTIRRGHIPKHSADVLRKMKKDGLITYNKKSPCVSYDKTMNEKEQEIINYTVL